MNEIYLRANSNTKKAGHVLIDLLLGVKLIYSNTITICVIRDRKDINTQMFLDFSLGK